MADRSRYTYHRGGYRGRGSGRGNFRSQTVCETEDEEDNRSSIVQKMDFVVTKDKKDKKKK